MVESECKKNFALRKYEIKYKFRLVFDMSLISGGIFHMFLFGCFEYAKWTIIDLLVWSNSSHSNRRFSDSYSYEY